MKRTPLKSKKGFKKGIYGVTIKNNFARGIWVKAQATPQQILDGIVSKVVRIGSADDKGMVRCATCPAIKHWKEMQCGHYQKRGNLATRYDMRNLAPQCEDCNCFYDGEEKKFAEFIDRFYGDGTAKALKIQAREIMHNYPYDQEIIKWRAVLNRLLLDRDNNIEF